MRPLLHSLACAVFLCGGCTRGAPSLSAVRAATARFLDCDWVRVSWSGAHDGSWVAHGCDELHICGEGSPGIRCEEAELSRSAREARLRQALTRRTGCPPGTVRIEERHRSPSGRLSYGVSTCRRWYRCEHSPGHDMDCEPDPPPPPTSRPSSRPVGDGR